MKRRPHWTDDLIEAVKDAISSWCFDHVEGPLYDDDVYPVIAAVEDWYRGRADELSVVDVIWGKARLAQAEAAIQRVRELHHPIPGFNGTQWCGAHCEATADGDPTEYPCETIRALDGGAK